MRKIAFVLLASAILASCGSGAEKTSTSTTDSTKVAVDTTAKSVDTTATKAVDTAVKAAK